MGDLGIQAEPVLVIYGVANRDASSFGASVESLQRTVNAIAGGPRYRFYPAYWGDLQPDFAGIVDTIPGIETMATIRLDIPSVGAGFGLPGRLGWLIDRLFTKWPFEDWAERATTKIRVATLPPAAEGIGDVFTYVSARDRIQVRMREVLRGIDPTLGTADRPISVIGHSLGGIIAFDAAASTAPEIHIKHLITVGSQSAALHVLDPRQRVLLPPSGGARALEPYVPGRPVVLPDTIGSWLSIWHAMDPLAFLAGKVFRLSDGSAVRDHRIEGEERSWSLAHSSYWHHAAVPPVIHEALVADGNRPTGSA